MNNIILIDSNYDEAVDFKNALSKITESKWETWVCSSNGSRTNKLYNLYRYFQYIFFPLAVLFKVKNKNIEWIVAWQQFYGIFLAFWCRLFHVKEKSNIVIMTFIYKAKSGIVGKIYYRLLKFALQSEYINIITCASNTEIAMYSEIFQLDINKFSFVHWGEVDYTDKVEENSLSDEKYIFSTGRSNRDWDFIISSFKNSKYNLKIACDELKAKKDCNIEIYDDIFGLEMFSYLKNCYCVVISIADTNISAGQTVLIHAMNFGKPVIITASASLNDYIIDGYNGLIVSKNKESLLCAVEKLYNDKYLYDLLAKNGKEEFERKYSKKTLGENIGKAIITRRRIIS